jgi:sec-independent protein translocase protein TatC
MVTSQQIIGAVHWLAKFRRKIIFIILLPILLAIGVFFTGNDLFKVVTKPLAGISLYFITPVDGIMVKVKLALLGGLILSLPIEGYLITSMFTAGMARQKKSVIYFLTIPFAVFCFWGGLVFGYFLILQPAIKFLLSCGNEFMKPMISANSYCSLFIFLLLTIGLVFELPLILVILAKVGLINSQILRKQRKMAVLLIFIIMAIVTPTPDAFTLIAVATPMTVLYEISIWWIYISEKGKTPKNSGEIQQ